MPYDPFETFLASVGLLIAAFGLFVLLAGVVLRLLDGDRVDGHWPVGLDEEPTLQVQNRLGDARRVR